MMYIIYVYRVFNKYRTSKFLMGVMQDNKQEYKIIILWGVRGKR